MKYADVPTEVLKKEVLDIEARILELRGRVKEINHEVTFRENADVNARQIDRLLDMTPDEIARLKAHRAAKKQAVRAGQVESTAKVSSGSSVAGE